MKKLIGVVVLAMASIGTANANPLFAIGGAAEPALTVAFGYMLKADDEAKDPRLFETVKARHNDDSGYEFTITKYEFDNAPGKYVLVK